MCFEEGMKLKMEILEGKQVAEKIKSKMLYNIKEKYDIITKNIKRGI